MRKMEKNATKSPSHQIPPKLIITTFTLVEFGVFVIWWQKRLLKVSNLRG